MTRSVVFAVSNLVNVIASWPLNQNAIIQCNAAMGY